MRKENGKDLWNEKETHFEQDVDGFRGKRRNVIEYEEREVAY